MDCLGILHRGVHDTTNFLPILIASTLLSGQPLQLTTFMLGSCRYTRSWSSSDSNRTHRRNSPCPFFSRNALPFSSDECHLSDWPCRHTIDLPSVDARRNCMRIGPNSDWTQVRVQDRQLLHKDVPVRGHYHVVFIGHPLQSYTLVPQSRASHVIL